jgi:hypothetical protein
MQTFLHEVLALAVCVGAGKLAKVGKQRKIPAQALNFW